MSGDRLVEREVRTAGGAPLATFHSSEVAADAYVIGWKQCLQASGSDGVSRADAAVVEAVPTSEPEPQVAKIEVELGRHIPRFGRAGWGCACGTSGVTFPDWAHHLAPTLVRLATEGTQ